jgi:hypothetical protein
MSNIRGGVLIALALLTLAMPARADNINTATATASTQAEACDSAMRAASIPAMGQVVREKKCDCAQEAKSGPTKWSCVGAVAYSMREHSAPVYNGVNVPAKGK